MGTMIGNIFGLVAAIAIVVVSLFSLFVGLIVFLIISYGAWFFIFASNIVTNPKDGSEIMRPMSPDEKIVYRRYHLHFWTPGAALMYSSFMNLLRIVGIVLGGIGLWNEYYLSGVLSIAYFFVTGSLILKLNPWLYLGSGAKNGNEYAIQELALIDKVNEVRESYNSAEET